jgi:hypothetical protein
METAVLLWRLFSIERSVFEDNLPTETSIRSEIINLLTEGSKRGHIDEI